MEAKKFIASKLEKRNVVIMTSLDVKGAFDIAWWPSILKGLKDAGCPGNQYYLSRGYVNQRTAVMSSNSVSVKKSVRKGCAQGSFAAMASGICFTIHFLHWNLKVIQKQ